MSEKSLLAGFALIALAAGCGPGPQENPANEVAAIDDVANDVMANAYDMPTNAAEADNSASAPMNVEAKVVELVVAHLETEPDRVTMSTRFREDLRADSLDLVELVMAYEEEFGIEIPDDDAERIKTVGDAVTYIRAKAAT